MKHYIYLYLHGCAGRPLIALHHISSHLWLMNRAAIGRVQTGDNVKLSIWSIQLQHLPICMIEASSRANDKNGIEFKRKFFKPSSGFHPTTVGTSVKAFSYCCQPDCKHVNCLQFRLHVNHTWSRLQWINKSNNAIMTKRRNKHTYVSNRKEAATTTKTKKKKKMLRVSVAVCTYNGWKRSSIDFWLVLIGFSSSSSRRWSINSAYKSICKRRPTPHSSPGEFIDCGFDLWLHFCSFCLMVFLQPP